MRVRNLISIVVSILIPLQGAFAEERTTRNDSQADLTSLTATVDAYMKGRNKKAAAERVQSILARYDSPGRANLITSRDTPASLRQKMDRLIVNACQIPHQVAENSGPSEEVTMSKARAIAMALAVCAGLAATAADAKVSYDLAGGLQETARHSTGAGW